MDGVSVALGSRGTTVDVARQCRKKLEGMKSLGGSVVAAFRTDC